MIPTLWSANMGSDHRLLLAKLDLETKITKSKLPEINLRSEIYNIKKTKILYQNRIRDMLNKHDMESETNIETIRKTIK